jgi:hypothetical protein
MDIITAFEAVVAGSSPAGGKRKIFEFYKIFGIIALLVVSAKLQVDLAGMV